MDLNIRINKNNYNLSSLINERRLNKNENLVINVRSKNVSTKEFMNSENIKTLLSYIVKYDFPSFKVNFDMDDKITLNSELVFSFSKSDTDKNIPIVRIVGENLEFIFKTLYDNIDLVKKIFLKYNGLGFFSAVPLERVKGKSFGFVSNREFVYNFGFCDDYKNEVSFLKDLIDAIDFEKILEVKNSDIVNILDNLKDFYRLDKIKVYNHVNASQEFIYVDYANGNEVYFRYLPSGGYRVETLINLYTDKDIKSGVDFHNEIKNKFSSNNVGYSFGYSVYHPDIDTINNFIFNYLDKLMVNKVSFMVGSGVFKITFHSGGNEMSFDFNGINNVDSLLKIFGNVINKVPSINISTLFLNASGFIDFSLLDDKDIVNINFGKLNKLLSKENYELLGTISLLTSKLFSTNKSVVFNFCK